MRRSSRQKKVQYKEFNSDSEDAPDPFDDDSEDDFKPEPSTSKSTPGELQLSDGSSSDSDLDTYLRKPEALDLKSPFFKTNAKPKTSFDKIEKNILSGIRCLSDSDSNEEENVAIDRQVEAETATLNFQQLSEYARKIEEAKKHVEKYNAKKKKKKVLEKKEDVGSLLTIGEKNNVKSDESAIGLCKSSEFETESDSEKEDWEEVAEGVEKSVIPKEGVEITVEMPDVIQKKKKSVDLLAAVKRRLNRVRKENQILVHKVHLLCWIAHGNYVNGELNQPSVLAVALSLLPSQQSFPPDRVNLKYLEQIVTWFKKGIKFKEEKLPKSIPLANALITQMNKKQCANQKAFVYVFICILRALGIKCRLVLSLQVEPLKPPPSELCSTSTKEKSKENSKKVKNDTTTIKNEPITKYVGKKKSRTVQDFGPSTKRKRVEVRPKTASRQTKSKEAIVETNKTSKENTTKSKIDSDKDKDKVQNNVSNSAKTSEETSRRSVRRTVNREIDKSKDQSIPSSKSRSARSKSENVAGKDKKLGASNGPLKEQSTKVKVDTKIKEPKSKPIQEPEKTVENTKSKSRSTKSTKKGNEKKNNPETEIDDIVAVLEKSEKAEVKVKPRSNKDITAPTTNGSLDSKSVSPLPPRRRTRSTYTSVMSEAGLSEKPSTVKAKKANTLTAPNTSDLLDRDEWRRSKSISPQPPRRRTRSTYKSVTSEAGLTEKPRTVNARKGEKRVMQVDGADDDDDASPPPSKKLRGRSSVIKPIYKNADSESEFSTESPERKPNLKKLRDSASDRKTSASEDDAAKSKGDVRSDIIKLVKASMSEQRHNERAKKVGKSISYEDSDSDYAPELSPRKRSDPDKTLDDKKVKVKRRIPPKSELIRKVLSSGEENDKPKEQKGNNVWIEVFMEDEEKWISVDVVGGKIHCVKDLFSKATHPVSYILSWDNTNRVKDVTKRYCPNWNTVTRKLRIDPKWWEESLRPFLGAQTARDKEEDEDLARQELDQPLPKTISEYKNHPLYVLKRHLLKFEAIYPPDAVTLGFVREEAVYSRDCVYTLHSRELWLKEAKTVKLGEKPYKIVKARPKWDRLSNKMITDLPLEVFGPWQVQDYEPPTAENGIVPRNAYGNVELFKECMLPKKTVHLRLPGLNKVARKLKIDCASAVVGFDFHSGWNHPTYDGYIVCEEFKDTLIEAWTQEQEEIEKREQEKYEKRVYGNWKRLIKGLLIRERLKARYDFGQPTE